MKIERTRIDFFSDVFLPSPSSDLKVPIHSREEGKKVTALLRRWSPRGLGTPEVKIASVPVPAFTRCFWFSHLLLLQREFLAYSQPRSMTSRRVHCQNTYKQVWCCNIISAKLYQNIVNVILTSYILTHQVTASSLKWSAVVSCVLSEQVCNSR